eukprot:CAMPEP_0174260696 /NCGR_PEP_ID=MMETSP0439-20130205/10306_1 /TAXON_ID=0 /ORGANISM="Stereomyxa ramosa, Strain Chinc5" /LENGTH=623 /DNA_ID=CAMNT_0015344999 /DNA_START=50 /DNA_END=1921 /DNA_ORIENTATION=-
MTEKCCLVTGGCGFVGWRMVEMLLEHTSAETVVVLDIQKPSDQLASHDNVIFVQGDLSKREDVERAFGAGKVEVVFHIAALVGPYHPRHLYEQVNHVGTLNIIDCCKKFHVPKLVFCSSPSTRFHGSDIVHMTEDAPYPSSYSELYAETKASAERAVVNSNNEDENSKDFLLTCTISPHQVYGEGDTLFLPNFIETAKADILRIMGDGKNMISVTYVDNLCYAMILACTHLYVSSPACGEVFFVNDGEDVNFWDMLDEAITACGIKSIKTKAKLPYWLLSPVAHAGKFVGSVTGKKVKLTPFSLQMITIHRTFSVDKIKKILEYEPLVSHPVAWKQTCDHFKANYGVSEKSVNSKSSGLFKTAFYVVYAMFIMGLFWKYTDMLAAQVHKSPQKWNWEETIVFNIIMFSTFMVIDLFLDIFFGRSHRLVEKGIHLEHLGWKDYYYLNINRLASLVFFYDLLTFAWTSERVSWELSEITVTNTLLALVSYFLIYDFFYCIFHRALHMRAIYPYIHKHHHRDCAPTRGNVDAMNTHPFEFIVGEYIHLLAVYLFPSSHALAILLFLLIGGGLASLNHTRYDVKLPFEKFFLYSVSDHDYHHHAVRANYGTYVMVWDMLAGSYKHQD